MLCPSCSFQNSSESYFCGRCGLHLLPVGDYLLTKTIGKGGFARVYRAKNRFTEQPAAVKIIHSELSEKPRVRQRFEREAEVLRNLHSPHIVQIYDYGVLDEHGPYLVMEWLQGHSLQQLMDQKPHKRFSMDEAIRLTSQLLYGLHHIHEKDIIHRDLKPQNLFVIEQQGQSTLKILDFGLAWVEGEEHLTKTGTVVGSSLFMSPEQFTSNKGDYGPWTDLYAAGLILFWMLTGKYAFPGDTVGEQALQHLSKPVPRLQDACPGLAFPPHLDKIIAYALRKNPSKRFQSAKDFLEAFQHPDQLEEIPSEESAYQAEVSIWQTPSRPITPNRKPSLPPAFGSIMAVLVLVGIVLLFFVRPWFFPPPKSGKNANKQDSLLNDDDLDSKEPVRRFFSKKVRIQVMGVKGAHSASDLTDWCDLFRPISASCTTAFTKDVFIGRKVLFRKGFLQEANKLNKRFLQGKGILNLRSGAIPFDLGVVFGGRKVEKKKKVQPRIQIKVLKPVERPTLEKPHTESLKLIPIKKLIEKRPVLRPKAPGKRILPLIRSKTPIIRGVIIQKKPKRRKPPKGTRDKWKH